MHSYIGIHQFTPPARFQAIETLLPFIDQSMLDQNAEALLGSDAISAFKDNIVQCLKVYYRLLGVTDEVIAGEGKVEAKGILPRYTESLISYFQNMPQRDPHNKEIKILEYSGVTSIKIRYKYTQSVIKKLIKLGLQDPGILDRPLEIFLKGGALHDLIGLQFICASPYTKVWAARAMYTFFEYDYRTDDHLVYGFYTVERESGYRGLHCDHTCFYPRFDAGFSRKESAVLEDETIFSLLDENDDDTTVLDKLKNYFNIEIQLHTAFENLWSTMEHINSYNVQAKGSGRNAEITAQWKLLSDNMKNLEMQFERLQIDTEQARFKDPHREGYAFIKHIFTELECLNDNVYRIYRNFFKKIEKLETYFSAREISRQDYVEQVLNEAKQIDAFSKSVEDPTTQVLFKLASAFVRYGLANHRAFFNSYDLNEFVQRALSCYEEIRSFLYDNPEIYKGKMMHVIANLRYLQLAQKYGYGLIDLKDVTLTYSTTPAVPYQKSVLLFQEVLFLMNRLSDEGLADLKQDYASYIKVVYRIEILAQEWELFKTDPDSNEAENISQEITRFRTNFIKASLLDQLETLLSTNKITNVGFVVRFYTLMVWHHICQPIDAMKQIIKYSAYDKIKTSDILYYELAAYKFLVVDRCAALKDCSTNRRPEAYESEKIEHYRNYHRNNMIQQLFRIYRDESIYDFHKARAHFESLTQVQFNISHFSDMLREENL